MSTARSELGPDSTFCLVDRIFRHHFLFRPFPFLSTSPMDHRLAFVLRPCLPHSLCSPEVRSHSAALGVENQPYRDVSPGHEQGCHLGSETPPSPQPPSAPQPTAPHIPSLPAHALITGNHMGLVLWLFQEKLPSPSRWGLYLHLCTPSTEIYSANAYVPNHSLDIFLFMQIICLRN